MAWSEIGDVSQPATENGTYSHLDANPVSITPPTMSSGDLVVVVCVRHSNITNTWTVSNAGGQSWTSQTNRNPLKDCESRTFTCIYNGTWSANPTFQYSDTTSSGPVTVRMFVFRDSNGTPPSAAPEDGEDYTQEFGTVHSGNTLTTLTDGALVVHWYAWEDDNTVTVNTPTGWTNGGGDAYYRNSYAPGNGNSLHWQEQATAGTSATFTVTQAFSDDVGIHSLAFAPAAAGTTISLNAGAWAAWSSQSPQATLAAGLTSPAWASWAGQNVDAVVGQALGSATWASWAGQATQNALSAGLASGTITAWAGQSTQNTATNSVAAGSVAAWSGQDTQNAVVTDLSAGSMGFTSQVISIVGNLVLDLGSAAMSFVAGTVSTAAAAVVAGMRGMILNIGRLLNR